MDISKITSADILERFGKPDVIWASPDCTTYSIAGISHHRVQEPNGNLAPVSEYAKFCDTLNRHVLKLISELQPTFWFIENPRGGMRILLADRQRRYPARSPFGSSQQPENGSGHDGQHS